MQRQPVISSRVASIGWLDGTMEVEFNNGAIYQYSPVEWQTVLNMITGQTIGRDIQAIISNKEIKCVKL